MAAFRTVLVANRGEIARRILRTVRALGLRGVAVFSDADADAGHVAEADAAIRLGAAPARDSYLSIEALLAAARESGAEAVHPGYGFLAENAGFARACEDAGLVFVGPPAAAIELMGSKDAARSRMIEAGVPVLPGAGAAAVEADPQAAAREVGFPLLVKAVAGGGGKGMRVVRAAEELDDALAAVRREAGAAFGDEAVLFERWLGSARHVEVQVFADAHGRCVHLFDRECSLQRRHQKVLEEAPAPDVPEAVRAAMAEAAVAAARAVDYRGAGTVEFLLAGEEFFFLEMNTRLQVEHPVTEMVTGQDLVAWQLKVAAGEPLPRTQEALVCRGHAVEVRLYAEDPAAGFLPASGTVTGLALPEALPGVRVDAGVRLGDVVGTHYDPLLAKIAARGDDRAQALGRLAGALDRTRVRGLVTNLPFLRALLASDAVRRGPVTTGWLEEWASALLPSSEPSTEDLATAALAVALLRAEAVAASDDPFRRLRGFRIAAPPAERVRLGVGEAAHDCRVVRQGPAVQVRVDEAVLDGRARLEGGRLEVVLDGRRRVHEVALDERAERPVVRLDGPDGPRVLELLDVLAPALSRDEAAPGSLEAPMPGQVVAIPVRVGDAVAAGAALVVVEAMKMEHTLRAPEAGVVRALHCAVGDRVDAGTRLVELDET
ncbi:MAG: biotin carboxylase N-terminal domain-containing protein [Pseudomonadales bacterium]|nr:biotin carboxylase N-terminal domain-containing protein [Pseudomonadales bacterium]